MDAHEHQHSAVHLSFNEMNSIPEIETAIVACERCPRLRVYCAEVAQRKRRAFRDDDYWGKPVPGFGDPAAQILIVGLAPAAHGANRTGRMFTGDRSGDFLYAALHRAGLASQPYSNGRNDGLTLRNVYIGDVARCAPPENKPLPQEIEACRHYLQAEITALSNLRLILALGKIAFDNVWVILKDKGLAPAKPRLPFVHGKLYDLGRLALAACYHPSQRNTSTGLITSAMMDEVLGNVLLMVSRELSAE